MITRAPTDRGGGSGLPEISSPRFVGRQREMTDLGRALARPPAVVLVEGEAGIGKSRLVQEFFTSEALGRHETLIAVCPPFRESLTLGSIVDAIRQVCGQVAGLGLSGQAGALRPLFPEWAADLPPAPEPLEDAKAARHRLFRALSELVGCLDVSVLVVEDVHWADEATLEFLLFLVARRQSHCVSLVVTYRPEDVPAGSLLLRLSSRLPAGTTRLRLALEPLDVAGTASLVSSMLAGERVSESFARFLHDRTDGLPLAVEESVRLLRDRADLVRQGRVWVRRSLDNLKVPPTVRDSVLERVQRLSPAAQHVLQAASVLAEVADETALTEVAGVTANQARIGLTQALASGLLLEDQQGCVTFRHALMGRAVYEAIPGPERRRQHRSAGHALEGVEPLPVVQLTRHFREAGETGKWIHYAEQAADRATASGDRTPAVTLLNDLLATADLPRATRVRLARKLAAAALFRGEAVDDLHRQVVGTLRAVLDTAGLSATEQAELRNLLGRLLIQLGEFEAARTELERAIPDLEHEPVEAARVMTYLAWPLAGPSPAAVHLRWLRRAADVVANIHSPVDRLALTVDRATALLQLGEESGWIVAAELPTEAPRAEERRQLARGCANIGVAAIVWGRYTEARRRLAAALELADADGFQRIHSKVLVTQADLDWFTGVWDGLAERAAALADANEGEPLAHLVAVRLAGRLHAARGARRMAEEFFGLTLDQARQLGVVDDELEPAAALGRLRLADGHVDEALRMTDEAMQKLMTKAIWVWATDIAPVRVEALVAVGRDGEAARLVSAFARGLRGRNAPAAKAALATCRAILVEGEGVPAAAAASFSRAASAWDSLPRPYDALLGRERQALCMLAAGRAEAGVTLLSEVYEQLSDLGARGDADRVAQRLREHGAEVPRRWRGGRHGYGDQLSPRELKVVRLVVAGKTNREIARVLCKSSATVGRQLQSAMRKLGVSSRTALAVTAVEAGVFAEDR